MPTIKAEQIIQNVPGVQSVRIPNSWYQAIPTNTSVFNSLYQWLCCTGRVPEDTRRTLHDRMFVGEKTLRRLIAAERRRILTFRKRHRRNTSKDSVDRAVLHSTISNGPLSVFAGMEIAGDVVLVIPDEQMDALEAFQEALDISTWEREVQQAKAHAAGASFYQWLLSQLERDDHVGDVARDAFVDTHFPQQDMPFEVLRGYLEGADVKACKAAVEAFEDAWLEYVQQYPDRIKPGASCDVCGRFVSLDHAWFVTYPDDALREYAVCCQSCSRIPMCSATPLLRLREPEACEFIKTWVHLEFSRKELFRRLNLWGVTPLSEQGTIYFLKADSIHTIKIGYTAGPVEQRIQSLQTAHPYPLHLLGPFRGHETTNAPIIANLHSIAYAESGFGLTPNSCLFCHCYLERDKHHERFHTHLLSLRPFQVVLLAAQLERHHLRLPHPECRQHRRHPRLRDGHLHSHRERLQRIRGKSKRMNIITNTQTFAHELTAHNSIVDKKQTIPSLGCISVKAEAGTLTLESNNLERGLISTVADTEILIPGHVLIPGAELTKIVKALPGEQVRLTTDEHTVTITSGASSFSLSLVPNAEDFPAVSTFGFTPLCRLSGAELRDLLTPTLFAVSSDESRYALNGTLWELTERDDLRSVATDGHRLQAAKVSGIQHQDTADLIVPGKAGADLLRIFDADAALEMSKSDGMLSVRAGTRTFVTRLIDAQFPDYRAVIPAVGPDTHRVTLDREALIRVLRRVSLLAADTQLVQFAVAPGELTLTAKDPNIGEAEEMVACEYDGSGLVTGYNAKYVLDALNAFRTEKIEWQAKDALSPGKLTGIGQAGQVSIVMPMRVN